MQKENTDDASLSEGDKSSSEMDNGDEVNESGPRKGKAVELSESEDDDETHDMPQENEHEKEDLEKGNKEKKRVSKQKDSIGMEMVGTNSKAELVAATAKGSTKQSSSLHTKTRDGADDASTKVFSRKKKVADSPKKKPTIRSAKKEKDTGNLSSINCHYMSGYERSGPFFIHARLYYPAPLNRYIHELCHLCRY